MKKELSIQAFSVRDVMNTAEETADTFKKLASYGFTGIQTAGAFAFSVEDYAKAAREAGLRVVGTHIPFDLFDNIEEVVRIHRILGTTNAGIGHWWDTSLEKVLAFTEKVNKIGEALSQYGMKFTFHHHSREFAKIGNDTIMDILVKEMNPKTTSFVLDTYWLQNGGVNVLEWIEKLAGRVDILHLKDWGVPMGSRDGTIVELGAGNLNFKDIIRVAEASGVQEYCYEQDGNHKINSLESARQSAEYFFSLVD